MSASERHAPFVSIVVPCYNESDVVELFHQTVSRHIQTLDCVGYEFVFVNDGSRDRTLDCLRDLATRDPRVSVIDLARNFGKEAALTAGLFEAAGDVLVPMDADLQDPPELLTDFLAYWRKGFDVVLARRADRSSDGLFKRTTARWFYRLHSRLCEVDLPENVGDYRLMDRKVVDALKALPERHRFMKGLFAWVGHRTTVVDYVRSPRAAGTTKFSGWKLWNLALEGITSFSTLPLRIWTYLGAVIASASILYATFIVLRTLLLGVDLPGYASLLTSILLLSGIQLIGIGIVGEYVGRIYMESKQRPLYLIQARYGRNPSEQVKSEHHEHI